MRENLKIGGIKSGDRFTMVAYNTLHNYYWADADLSFVNKKWTIMLIHKGTREITVCEVLPGTFSLTEELAKNPEKLRTRVKVKETGGGDVSV